MYHLTWEMWEQLGYPDVSEYVDDSMDSDDGMWLNIDMTDSDGDTIPDLLEQLAGGDVILKPSQGVAFG